MKTDRQGFNFLLSYYKVFKKLPDAESKAKFIEAVCEMQFNGVKIELEGMADFAYDSQEHSILKSRKGFLDVKKRKTFKTPSIDPRQDPSEGASEDPSEQEKVQVQVKEQVQEEVNTTKAKAIDFDNLLTYINKTFGRDFRVINQTVRRKYLARLKEGYTAKDIRTAIDNAKKADNHKESDFKYCTPEFFSRSTTLDLHSTTKKSNQPYIPTA